MVKLRRMNFCACNQPWSELKMNDLDFGRLRYRFVEAYQVDRKLQCVEQDFISKNSVSEVVISRMRSASHWRAGLVEKSIELLPEFQQEVKSGKLLEIAVSTINERETPAKV
ncbi:hypothetical protein ACSBR2_013873 [Camellia fascicularis]